LKREGEEVKGRGGEREIVVLAGRDYKSAPAVRGEKYE